MGALHYVVRTKPKAEAVAKANLLNQDFIVDVYCPALIVEKRSRHGLVIGSRIEPMFRRYLLVCFDVSDPRWRKISNTRGVEKIIGGNPERPTAVPDYVIADLKATFGVGAFKPARTPALSAGETGFVRGGSFANRIGECIRSEKGRVRLLLTILGVAAEVEFDAAQVGRAGEDEPESCGYPLARAAG